MNDQDHDQDARRRLVAALSEEIEGYRRNWVLATPRSCRRASDKHSR
jgi:hypothetical protein